MEDTLYIEFGESRGPFDWGQADHVALATPKLMTCYLVEAEVRDNPPEEEFKMWLWALKGEQMHAYGVVLAPCLFYVPVRPPKFDKLYGFITEAIKTGKLPLRDRETLYPFSVDRVTDIGGDIREDGYISVADVWEWQRASKVPTLPSAKELWKWCNPKRHGWYGWYIFTDRIEPRNGVGRPRKGGQDDETLAQHWQEIESLFSNQGALAIAQKVIAAHPELYEGVTAESLKKRHIRYLPKTGQNK
jgi:hypothetical protein